MYVYGYWNYDFCFKLCMLKVCFIVFMEVICEYCLVVFLVELLRRNGDLLNKIWFKGRVWFKKYLFVMKWFCLKVELLEMSWWLIYGFCFFEY